MTSKKSELPKQQEQYHALFMNMLDAFALHEMIFDIDGKPIDYRFITVNPAFEKLTGLKAENIVNRTIKEIMPNIEPEWIETYGKVVVSGITVTFENFSADLNKYFLVNAYKSGKNQFAVTFQDITEHKSSVLAFQESELRYRSIFDNSPLSFWEEDFSEIKNRFDMLKKDGVSDIRSYMDIHPGFAAEMASMIKVTEINKASAKNLGAESVEEVKRSLGVYFTEESYEVFREELISLFNGNTSFKSEIPLLNIKSENVIFDLELVVLPGFENTLKRVLISFSDITEKKQQEKFLSLLNSMAVKLGESENLQEVLELILSTAIEISGMNSGGIYLLDEKTGGLILVAHKGLSETFINSTSYFPPDSYSTKLVMEGKPIYGHHGKMSNDNKELREGIKTLSIFPILHNGKIIGCINIASNKNDEIPQIKRMMAEVLTSQLGGFISRAVLYDETKQNKEQLVNAAVIANLGPWEYDVDNDLFTFNDLFYKVFRTSVIEAGGYTMKSADYAAKFLHPDDAEQVGEEIRMSIESKNPNYTRYLEHRILYSDGSPGHIAVRFYIQKDKSGRTIKTFGVNQDITQRKMAEENLRLLNNRLETIINVSPLAILMVDLNDRIYMWNPAAEKMFGYSKSDVIGLPNPLILDKYETEYNELKKNIYGGKPTINYETTRKRKDGSLVHVSISSASVLDSEGNCIGRMAVISDVTERKQIQNILQARLDLITFAQHHSTDELLRETLDQIEKLTGSSIGFYHFVNKDQKTLTLQNWSTNTIKNMCTAEGKGAHYDIDKAGVWVDCVNTGEPVIHNDYEALPHKKGMPEGHAKVIREAVVPIKRGGKITAIIGVGNKPTLYDDNDLKMISQIGDLSWDIVERKLVETELKESEERYRHLVEYSPDALLIHQKGIIVYANPATLRLFGAEKMEQIVGTPLQERIHPDFRNIVAGRLEKIFNQGVVVPMIEEKLLRMDGSVVVADVIGIYFSFQGAPAVQVIARDITERKESERKIELYQNHLEELVNQRTKEIELINRKLISEIEKEKEIELMIKEALAKERELNELKSRFISTASHEFKTPLTAVLSSVELMQRYGKGWEQEKHDKHIERVKVSVDHLTKLIDDVLTLSRSDDGKMAYCPQKLDFEKLCRQFIEDSAPKGKSSHTFKFDYNSGDKEIDADPKLWRFIIVNLLTNAFKYSPNGGKVCLRVRIDDINIKVRIKDEGVGIPKEDAAFLFEPFYRARNAAEIEGTGLGLSIVKRAVDVHNGNISFESQPGHGTTFDILVPRYRY